MPTITPNTSVMRTKIDAEMTHLEKKNIDLAIRQKLRKKYVYETYSYKMSPTN